MAATHSNRLAATACLSLALHAGFYVLLGVADRQQTRHASEGTGPFLIALAEVSPGAADPIGGSVARVKAKKISMAKEAQGSKEKEMRGFVDDTSMLEGAPIAQQAGEGISAAASVSAGAGGEGGSEARVVLEYLTGLREEIQRQVVYPVEAKPFRLSGHVEVEFDIDRRGNVSNAALMRSCPHDVLNRAALQLIRFLGPLKPPPEELIAERLRVSLPLQYSVQR